MKRDQKIVINKLAIMKVFFCLYIEFESMVFNDMNYLIFVDDLSHGLTGYNDYVSQICDFCLYEGEGNFTSYGYPLNYRDNLNCTYRISRIDLDETCQVELHFHDFDVPVNSSPFPLTNDQLECNEDYLEVGNRRFCGSNWRHKTEIIDFPKEQRELVFKFVSNSKLNGRGFWAEVKRRRGSCYGKRLKPQPVKTCEERFSEVEFELKSTNFPNYYPKNSDCTYFIRKVNRKICGLQLTFHKFDIESSEKCIYDYLEIDGQRLCGLLPDGNQKIVPFNSDQKVIIFQSDGKISRKGFHVNVRQISDCEDALPAPPSCNVCTNEDSGTLVSYGYPFRYRNNLFCTYTIDQKNSDYCQVELDFQDFELDESDNCSEDYFQIEGIRYCGNMLKSSRRIITFENKSTTFVFKTDSLRTKKGFSIQYKQLECTTNDLITDKATPLGSAVRPDAKYHHCDYVYNEKEFILQSENFSHNYFNNLDCNYYIRRNNTKVCYLQLKFIKFDVEASPECQYDYLEVGNTVRLCGSLQEETIRTYNFENSEKAIKFHSDSSTNRGGFYIKVNQIECQDQITPIRKSTSSGVPSVSLPPTTYKGPDEQNQQNQCNKEYHLREFEISSPGYPNSYSPEIDCSYVIKKLHPTICRIDITFYDFEIQPSDPSGYCKYDFIEFNAIRVCGEILKGTVRTYYFSSDTFIINFHSDNSVTSSDRGFRISVRQSECESNQIDYEKTPILTQPTLNCDRIYTDVLFELKSPNYPENYPSNANCKYTIIKRTDINVCQLEVNFVDVNLQTDEGCEKDYVDFNGQLMCGSLSGETTRLFPFEANEFVINFVSDDYISGRGFYLRIRQKECPIYDLPSSSVVTSKKQNSNALSRCGSIFSETSFELQSTNYPGFYENDAECVYIIRRKNEKICKIDLRFIDFDVDPSPDCNNDFLMIDGKRYCGEYNVNHLKTFPFYDPEKILLFKTDSSYSRRGFLIKGQQKECDNYPMNDPSQLDLAPSYPLICELCFTEAIGTIQSYDYPNNYPPFLNCKYKITALPNHCMVQLNFDEFNLELPGTNGCESDYLEINHVKYCGRQLEKANRK